MKYRERYTPVRQREIDNKQWCPGCEGYRDERSFAPNGLCIDCDEQVAPLHSTPRSIQ